MHILIIIIIIIIIRCFRKKLSLQETASLETCR